MKRKRFKLKAYSAKKNMFDAKILKNNQRLILNLITHSIYFPHDRRIALNKAFNLSVVLQRDAKSENNQIRKPKFQMWHKLNNPYLPNLRRSFKSCH